MSGARSYLLDTNVVLHATRENSAVSRAIDAQFGLSTSRFRPAICEVSIAELLAFAHSSTWGARRIEKLRGEIARCLVVPISTPGLHERWAEMSTALKADGRTIGQNDIWIAAAASVTGLTLLSTDGHFGWLQKLKLVDAVLLDGKSGMRIG